MILHSVYDRHDDTMVKALPYYSTNITAVHIPYTLSNSSHGYKNMHRDKVTAGALWKSKLVQYSITHSDWS